MEEFLAYAHLLREGLVSEEAYTERLHELFLEDPSNEDLFFLECETDLKKTVTYIITRFDYGNFDLDKYGKTLMEWLKVVYRKCEDIKQFAHKMYSLWEGLPFIDEEPFRFLSYADEPLGWEPPDEKQSRELYEKMLNWYDRKER